MSGDIEKYVKDCYFIKAEGTDAFASLEQELSEMKGIEIQRTYKRITTLAVKIYDKNTLATLQESYQIEPQNIIRMFQPSQQENNDYVSDE